MTTDTTTTNTTITAKQPPSEIWRIILGYENYQMSNLKRIIDGRNGKLLIDGTNIDNNTTVKLQKHEYELMNVNQLYTSTFPTSNVLNKINTDVSKATTDIIPVEIWKDIDGYPNYQVSNMGNFKNIKSNKLMSGWPAKTYTNISLKKDGISTTFRAHRLVAIAFIPNPDNKPQVNHLGAKTDNRVCMLEWSTRQENVRHAIDNITNLYKVAVQRIDPETKKVLHTYDSLDDVEADGYTAGGVTYYIKGLSQKPTYKGYIWKRVNEIKEEKVYPDEKWVSLADCIYPEISKYSQYSVSNLGRIRGIHGKILRPYTNVGPHTISLRETGTEQKKTLLVHRIIIMGFNIPNPDNKPEVDHINSISTCNILSNLCWANKKDQCDNLNSKDKIIKSLLLNVEVTDSNGIITKYAGLKSLAKLLGTSAECINKYSKNGEQYKGNTFKILGKTKNLINAS
ncbi:MAG: putative HNH endonuclease [Faunusvirus sp.]|jgi:hypothetical protein|uniref:Putative HNH endonuclease n=1 Tax=Faunusvirus sp. TaxID=2487766 RepID=A0A3G4ZZM2_9VIRU|nr:MAG: putative HNH endonuclease [Faunusvirus sp.]